MYDEFRNQPKVKNTIYEYLLLLTIFSLRLRAFEAKVYVYFKQDKNHLKCALKLIRGKNMDLIYIEKEYFFHPQISLITILCLHLGHKSFIISGRLNSSAFSPVSTGISSCWLIMSKFALP